LDENKDFDFASFLPTTKLDQCIKDLCGYLVTKKATANSQSEAAFTKQYIMPYMDSILLETTDENVIYTMQVKKKK
jgi:hypothetical protein